MSEDDQHAVQQAVTDVVDNNVNDPPSPASVDRHVQLTPPPTYDQLPPQYSAVGQRSDSAVVVSGSLAEPSGGKKSGVAPTSATEDLADQTCACGQVECDGKCEVVSVHVHVDQSGTTAVQRQGAVLYCIVHRLSARYVCTNNYKHILCRLFASFYLVLLI